MTTTTKTTSTTEWEECREDWKCHSGLRNNYYEGKRLSAESFNIEQRHGLERRRLLNRAIHGWGVVYGYAVAPKAAGLKIGAGLALDECGRELLHVEADLKLADLFDGQGAFIDPCELKPGKYLLSAHYAEQSITRVSVNDPCHCQRPQWDHTCETVRFSLTPFEQEECSGNLQCELHCECPEVDESAIDLESPPPMRGGQCCLCEHLTGISPGAECCRLIDVDVSHRPLHVDLKNGVPLAYFEIVENDNGRQFKAIDACAPRRLVKRNDLLYDLIRGCDLTRIAKFSWSEWHRNEDEKEFQFFDEMFGSNLDGDKNFLTKFSVEFTRPVLASSLRPDCFAMTLLFDEEHDLWWQSLRVPIVGVNTEWHPSDVKDYVLGTALVVNRVWVTDALRGGASLFKRSNCRVEIEVRGDFIVDCNGQAVDANARGSHGAPTGNGAPGGVFLSTFRVARRPADYVSTFA